MKARSGFTFFINDWFGVGGELGYNIEDPDSPILPTRNKVSKGAQVDPAQKKSRTQGRSPAVLLAPTVGDGLAADTRKPEWMRVRLDHGPTFRTVRSTVRTHGLTTVCEEAGCPNISECWNDGTATFMILGDTCTRHCRFCHVKTNSSGTPVDAEEPAKVAEAAIAKARMERNLAFLGTVGNNAPFVGLLGTFALGGAHVFSMRSFNDQEHLPADLRSR